MPRPRTRSSNKSDNQHLDETDEKLENSSEDEIKQLSESRSYSLVDNRQNIRPRSDLRHSNDTSSSVFQRRHNTSGSSSSDNCIASTEKRQLKPPALYPDLKNIDQDGGGEGSKEVDKSAKHIKSQLYPSLKKESDGESSSSEAIKSLLSDKESTSSDESTKPSVFLIGLIIVVIGLIIFVLYMFGEQPKPDDSVESPFNRFVSHMTSLEKTFPNQNKRLWRTIKASTIHVLNDTQSVYPVVILMASPAWNAHLSRCIARKITSGFESAQAMIPEESVMDIAQLRNLGPAMQKEKLDESLHLAFTSKKRKSFIIENLQLLHPEAALLLHGYCDNDNAPHKDVMMVMLLHIDEKDVNDVSGSSVEGYLDELWSRGLETDKVKALLSRVANNIVIVETEDNEILHNVCS